MDLLLRWRSLVLCHCIYAWSLREEAERKPRRRPSCARVRSVCCFPADLFRFLRRGPRSGGPQLDGTELSIKRTHANKQTKTHTLLLQT